MLNNGKSKPGKKRLVVIGNVAAAIICLLLIPVIVINMTIIIKSLIHPDEVADFMGYKSFIVVSGSMEPEINAGDLIFVRETDPQQLSIDDVIAFREGDAVVTHRITDITDTGTFVTKGDANNTVDNITVTKDMVEGEFLRAVPRLGNVALFIQTPAGVLLTAVLPLILFVLYFIWRARRSEREKQVRTSELEAELAQVRSELDAQTTATATVTAEDETDDKKSI